MSVPCLKGDGPSQGIKECSMVRADSISNKKYDNSLNNLAEEIAWDSGWLGGEYVRWFTCNGFAKRVITREPGGRIARSDQWSVSGDIYDEADRLMSYGFTVLVMFVDTEAKSVAALKWEEVKECITHSYERIYFVKLDKPLVNSSEFREGYKNGRSTNGRML